MPYDEWIEIGLAIKGALGDTAEGVEAWLEFCEQYEGNEVEVCLAKWDSFHPKSIGAGTLLHLAREAQRKKGLDLFAPVEDKAEAFGPSPPDTVQHWREPTYLAEAGALSDALGHVGWLIPGVLHRGSVYTLTAKPSAGKTSIACLPWPHRSRAGRPSPA